METNRLWNSIKSMVNAVKQFTTQKDQFYHCTRITNIFIPHSTGETPNYVNKQSIQYYWEAASGNNIFTLKNAVNIFSLPGYSSSGKGRFISIINSVCTLIYDKSMRLSVHIYPYCSYDWCFRPKPKTKVKNAGATFIISTQLYKDSIQNITDPVTAQ